MSVDCWDRDQKKIIHSVEQHPIVYKKRTRNKMTVKQYKEALKNAWDVITKETGMRHRACVHKWMNVKYKYAKLKSLINTGKVTEEHVMTHQKTGKYLDGTLSFLDPYLKEITESDISIQIHKSINALFGLETPQDESVVSHAKLKAILKKREKEEEDEYVPDCSDMQYLERVIEDVVKRKLTELFPNEDTKSNNTIPDPNNSNINLDKAKNNNFTIIRIRSESETIVEEAYNLDSDSENYMEDKNTHNYSVERCLTDNDHLVCNDTNDIENNTGNITVVTDTNDVSNSDMRKIFNELGEVLSLESKVKQELLKKRINGLVKELLEQV